MSSVCTVSQPAQNQTHPAACCTPINIKRDSNIVKLNTLIRDVTVSTYVLVYILELCTHIVIQV